MHMYMYMCMYLAGALQLDPAWRQLDPAWRLNTEQSGGTLRRCAFWL